MDQLSYLKYSFWQTFSFSFFLLSPAFLHCVPWREESKGPLIFVSSWVEKEVRVRIESTINESTFSK